MSKKSRWQTPKRPALEVYTCDAGCVYIKQEEVIYSADNPHEGEDAIIELVPEDVTVLIKWLQEALQEVTANLEKDG